MTNPLSFLAKIDDDSMCFHQEIRQDDADEFLMAIMKEIREVTVTVNTGKQFNEKTYLLHMKFYHEYGP